MFQKIIRNIILLLFSCTYLSIFSQDIPIGDWRDHLPYSDAVSVSYGNNIVYCATNSAVFMYDKDDASIERLNLVNGLSDIGLSKIKFNNYNNKIIIAYTNGNIDIIDENKNITNLSFVKNSNVIGSKTINHIYLQGKFAYLSTGFGIVVLDTENLEISETYLFGPLGSYIYTNAITIGNQYIYAATDQGVYFADKNSPNLIDYNEWSLLPDLGITNYRYIVEFSGKLFISSESNTWNGDTIYYNNSGVWQKFLPNGVNLENMCVSGGNTLALIWYTGITFFDLTLSQYNDINSYNTYSANPKELVIDNESNNWIADNKLGLVKYKTTGSEIISPNGPSSSIVFDMDFKNDDLWIVSGGYNESSFAPNDNSTYIYNSRISNTWTNTPEKINDIQEHLAKDAVCVAINPSNKNQVFIGTWDDGLFEFNNGNVSAIYTAQNSLLDSTYFGSTKIGALTFDRDNNLWISNSFTNNQLAVKTPDNNGYVFTFTGEISASNRFTKMIIDRNNYKWIVEPKINSLLVFDHGTLGEPNTGQAKLLTSNPENGNIPGNYLYSIVEDLDGEIWIGTDEGIAVFYNPSAVFDENIEAEQIHILQDGQTQILLETEAVTTIAIDGANRKWIGTRNSGVFLMSEDGTEEIEHFTTENSPLFSNNIFDIVINQKTGEVFFGTENGLLSYKGTATEANDDFTNIFVYPNPVKPDFSGTIAIRGLVEDTDVRITDISGNIVYQTTSLGGQAIWDGKDFNGNKVHTGVYMVFKIQRKALLFITLNTQRKV
jgi:hypothetical protein